MNGIEPFAESRPLIVRDSDIQNGNATFRGTRRPHQMRLFQAALDYLKQNSDLTNQALDVSLGPDGEIIVRSYDI